MKITRILGILFIIAGLMVVGSKLNLLPFQLPLGFLNGGVPNTVQGGLLLTDNVEKVSLALNLDAADIKIDAIDGDQLIKYHTNVPEFVVNQPDKSHIVLKTEKKLKVLKDQFFNGNLHRAAIWDLTINIAAVEGKLDFQELMVDTLTMNLASCDLTIFAADDNRPLNITVNAAAADMVVHVPKAKGVQVISSAIASDVSFDGIAFDKEGSTWTSDGAADADSMVVIHMNAAANTIKIIME